MRKSAFGKQKSLGKGFYIALAISVVAVGTVAYLTISRLNSSLNSCLLYTSTSIRFPHESYKSAWWECLLWAHQSSLCG